MKKKILIIIGIILIFLLTIGVFTSYKDSTRIKNNIEPKYVIKIVSYNENKVTYWGLGYKIVRYPSISPNEPFKNNIGLKFGNWFMTYKLPKNNKDNNYTYTIEVVKYDLQNGNKFNKYLEKDERTIYLASNIEEIYYSDNKNKITLKNYIQNTWQTTDDSVAHLTNNMRLHSELRDGGTKIFKSLEYDITIIKCNTISGSNDYFIGDYNMQYDNESMWNK